MRQPKFKVGDVLRVANPDQFLAAFGNKVRDRDAVLRENLMDLPMKGFEREFGGRILVEFQKRNGRGQPFREVMNEKSFVLKP